LIEQQKIWYALYVSSRQEKKVQDTLLHKGIEAYVPMVKTMRQWSDRKKMVELPLFNGYVFVHITSQENEKVIQTKSVVNFVRAEGKICPIREIEIDRLKQLVALGYQMEVNAINYQYKEGEKVKIVSGALKNIEGFVIENKEGKFIDVLLESIGQSIRVKLPREILIPA
jgi:transcription antitermination factor NusG